MYCAQAKAWSDVNVSSKWGGHLLAPVRPFTHDEGLLLTDKHSNHAELMDPGEQAAILVYPPNCTSKHRPMDHEVIQAFDVRSRTKLLSARVDMTEVAPSLRRQLEDRMRERGTLRLTKGHHPHILDAMELGVGAREGVTWATIARGDSIRRRSLLEKLDREF